MPRLNAGNEITSVTLDPGTARRMARATQIVEGLVPGDPRRFRPFITRIQLFKLQADMIGNGPTLARWVDRSGDERSEDNYLVYGYGNLLDNAKAGYLVPCFFDGEVWCAMPLDCTSDCLTSGSITAPTLLPGTVDEAYGPVAITSSGLTSGPSVAGLPTGLAFASGEISGTPTVTGEFLVKITGTGPKIGGAPEETCPITVAVLLVIEPEAV